MNHAMRCLRLSGQTRPRRLQKSYLARMVHIKRYSTAAEATLYKEPDFEEEIINVTPRVLRKKPAIPPFIKNLFIGNCNKELLAYPEVLNKSEMETMDLRVKNIEHVMSNKTLSFDEILAEFKRLKVFGAPVSTFYGGYEAIATERCKYLETIAANSVMSAIAVKNHWFGITTIYEGLQKKSIDSIMSEIATGSVHINICLKEKIATKPDQEPLKCKAYLNGQREWVISGEKMTNDAKNGYFLVLCHVDDEPAQVFLVHPDADSMFIKETYVKFRNTPATLLGFVDGDDKSVASKVATFMTNPIAQNRLETAAICMGFLRTAIKTIIEFTRNKYHSSTPVDELQNVQVSVSNAVASLYAIESMVYFTAGLMDGYENTDFDLECALCRLYATRRTFNAINSMIETVGIDEMPEECLKLADQARSLLLKEEHNDKISLYTAVSGLKHASVDLANEVKMLRNPFYYPQFLIKKLITSRRMFNDNPKLNLGLEENLHPSLQNVSRRLEYCILRLQYATERLFVLHGAEVVTEHRSLVRLTEVATEIYASLSSISRASRAYCIGLHMGDNEMVVSSLITSIVEKNVKHLVLEIDDAKYLNRDILREDIAKKSIKRGGFHYEHALERVFF